MIWNIRGNACLLMWCQLRCKSQLIDVMCWITCSGRCVSASMFRRGLTVVQWIGWDVVFRSRCASQFFVSQIQVMSCCFETLFRSLRFAITTCCANGLFSANRSTQSHRDGDKRIDLDLGLDMTLRPANLWRWNFNFFVPRKPHISDVDVGCRTWKCT